MKTAQTKVSKKVKKQEFEQNSLPVTTITKKNRKKDSP